MNEDDHRVGAHTGPPASRPTAIIPYAVRAEITVVRTGEFLEPLATPGARRGGETPGTDASRPAGA